MAESRTTGPNYDFGSYSRWHDVGTTEDDNCSFCRPEATVNEPDDDADDAIDVWYVYVDVPQWAGYLLGGFQYNWYRNSVFRHRWLGLLEMAKSAPPQGNGTEVNQ